MDIKKKVEIVRKMENLKENKGIQMEIRRKEMEEKEDVSRLTAKANKN